ncbi:auxin efflux carrier component 5 [Punica granatum]|uniref:Auxin efflux carrier component n=2 Tax=Punica granatum TaxID=22663 RepID=A0A2I0JHT8_PUNGR|nr:auxin efflux carrier component 5 [Punica granatum]PKI55480.1 hypothetical protein CRG98_024092 [Punica granatum]
MIGWEDIYKVVVAMVPLYLALMLGYGSVKWWHMFTPEQCDGINRFVCYFIVPLFCFEFTARHANLFEMNYLCLGADAVSKLLTVLAIAIWAKFSAKADYNWCITAFSLCTLTNLLIVGIPVVSSMYGQTGVDLIVQLCVVQSVIWFPILLCFLEFRKSRMDLSSNPDMKPVESVTSLDEKEKGTEGSASHDDTTRSITSTCSTRRSSLWSLTKVVGMKLAFNPTVCSCVLGIAWAVAAQRLKFKMPSIIEGCVLILSRAGTGTSMFTIGIFIAMQRKIIACGTGQSVLAMVLRFIVGPALATVASLAVGLHGNVLRIAIIQAALPQSITTFIFANEYGLHANVLSVAVVFGTLLSLPVLVTYYAVLEVI